MLIHLVFSTKNRTPLILDAIRDELHAYMSGIIKNQNGQLVKVGSVSDHIHLLLVHPRTCAPAELVKEIKTASTIWIKSKGAEYQYFHWQAGYAMFSISPSHKEAVEKYIANQSEHHRHISFQDEYRKLLEKNNIEWSEGYVWD